MTNDSNMCSVFVLPKKYHGFNILLSGFQKCDVIICQRRSGSHHSLLQAFTSSTAEEEVLSISGICLGRQTGGLCTRLADTHYYKRMELAHMFSPVHSPCNSKQPYSQFLLNSLICNLIFTCLLYIYKSVLSLSTDLIPTDFIILQQLPSPSECLKRAYKHTSVFIKKPDIEYFCPKWPFWGPQRPQVDRHNLWRFSEAWHMWIQVHEYFWHPLESVKATSGLHRSQKGSQMQPRIPSVTFRSSGQALHCGFGTHSKLNLQVQNLWIKKLDTLTTMSNNVHLCP